MTLKGIGEARAAAIIKGRPYARRNELVQKKVIPESGYNEIRDKIIAKQQASDGRRRSSRHRRSGGSKGRDAVEGD